MTADWHFWVMILAAAGLFVVNLALVLGPGPLLDRPGRVAWVTAVVVGLGMLFGRYGARLGCPWWVYYPVPALVNLALPPLVYRMSARQAGLSLVLGVLAAPLLHAGFTFGLGWPEYLPFWPLGRDAGG